MQFGRVVMAVALVGAAFISSGCPEKRARVRPIEVGPVDTGPQSLAAARRQLEGKWNLVSITAVQGSSTVDVKASGTMTYDAYGNMTVKGIVEGTGPASAGALLDYEGRAVIDVQARQLKLVGMVAQGAAAPPEELSFDKIRRYAFEGDLLKISTIDASGAVVATATWRRAQ
jgi:hypothetical protein